MATTAAYDKVLTEALDAAKDALARAKSAQAALEDTGETGPDHDEARKLHARVAELLAGQSDEHLTPDIGSAAARHSVAAAAHEFARVVGEAVDPRDDGCGVELGARTTNLAEGLSARALAATERLAAGKGVHE